MPILLLAHIYICFILVLQTVDKSDTTYAQLAKIRSFHSRALTASLFVLQAFIEMASEEAAMTMVNYYTTATPHVRNQPVYIQYSNHRELKTDNLPNQGVRSTYWQTALYIEAYDKITEVIHIHGILCVAWNIISFFLVFSAMF